MAEIIIFKCCFFFGKWGQPRALCLFGLPICPHLESQRHLQQENMPSFKFVRIQPSTGNYSLCLIGRAIRSIAIWWLQTSISFIVFPRCSTSKSSSNKFGRPDSRNSILALDYPIRPPKPPISSHLSTKFF